MILTTNDEIGPAWLDSNKIGFWEPDDLYLEWMTFLYTLWDNIEYL